jgi:hypothetical protein
VTAGNIGVISPRINSALFSDEPLLDDTHFHFREVGFALLQTPGPLPTNRKRRRLSRRSGFVHFCWSQSLGL